MSKTNRPAAVITAVESLGCNDAEIRIANLSDSPTLPSQSVLLRTSGADHWTVVYGRRADRVRFVSRDDAAAFATSVAMGWLLDLADGEMAVAS